MASPYTIVIRMPNHLGDIVMALPALRHINTVLPTATVYAAGREGYRRLLTSQPGVAGFIRAPGSGVGNFIGGFLAAWSGKALAGLAGGDGKGLRGHLDLGVLLTNTLTTAAWMWALGAKKRVGYDLYHRRLFLTDPVPCGEVENLWPFIRWYLWLARCAENAAGSGSDRAGEVATEEAPPPEDFPTPRLTIDEETRSSAREFLAANGIPPGQKYATLAPASGYGPVKDWRPDYYRRLVEILQDRLGLAVVVTGGKGQREVCESIASGHKAAVNLAGKTDLMGFLGIVAEGSAFVGGDSGGAHAAAALAVPTVAIFSVTNPERSRPSGPHVEILGGIQENIRLGTREARERAAKLMQGITPEMVATALKKAMRE